MPTAKELKEDFKPRAPRRTLRTDGQFLSTGLDVLNMALSGRVDGGIAKGTYEYFVGDSESGKTLTTLMLFAEACLNRGFDSYDLIYDGVENGLMAELADLFGARLAKRMRPPAGTMANPKNSVTAEEFYRRLDDQQSRRPTIWVLDSMDALISEADEKLFQESKEGPVNGTYGTGKAKANSDNIKRAVSKLPRNGSILIIISQTRDSIGGGPFQSKTRAGGKALRFYAHIELWTSIVETTKIRYKGKDRVIGNTIQIDVRKNRITGWHGKLRVPFLRGVGLDNLGASIRYLIDEGHWKRTKDGVIVAKEFSTSGTEEDLIREIGSSESERELQLIVQRVWQEIDQATTVQRKKRYL